MDRRLHILPRFPRARSPRAIRRPAFGRVGVAVLLLIVHLACTAAAQQAGRIGKNHERVKRLFRPVIARVNQSTVRVLAGRSARDVALGTIVGAEGYLLTRVNDFSGRLLCRLPDGRRLAAVPVATLPRCGLVLLHMDAHGLKPVVWCPGPPPVVGSLLATPGRGPDPVAIGVVSVPVERTSADGVGPHLQHDTILRAVDCGGPLVDLSGRVVGINVARANRAASYAVPAGVVRDALRATVAEHHDLARAIPLTRTVFDTANQRDLPPSKTDPRTAVLMRLETKVRKTAARAVACTVGLRVGRVMGSGVLVSRDGLIATAAHVSHATGRGVDTHVARGAGRVVSILLATGHVTRGRCLGADRRVDIALIKTAGSGPWSFADPAGAAPARAGQWCVATGHPRGYRPGRPPVVRLGRILIGATDAIVTDCVLTRGDSGGPLFDLDGNLIGIHTMVGRSLANNVHVPIPLLRRAWQRLAQGEVMGTTATTKERVEGARPPAR